MSRISHRPGIFEGTPERLFQRDDEGAAYEPSERSSVGLLAKSVTECLEWAVSGQDIGGQNRAPTSQTLCFLGSAGVWPPVCAGGTSALPGINSRSPSSGRTGVSAPKPLRHDNPLGRTHNAASADGVAAETFRLGRHRRIPWLPRNLGSRQAHVSEATHIMQAECPCFQEKTRFHACRGEAPPRLYLQTP